MDDLSASVLSNIIWDLIKKGVNVTKSFLKTKLKNWILDDESLEKIVDYVNGTPDVCLKSVGLLREYINSDENIVKILSNAIPSNEIEQKVEINYGTVIGSMHGNIINNYNDSRKPRSTLGESLVFTDMYNKYRPVQVVESFSSTRDGCEICNNGVPSVKANICIPEKVKLRSGCQFSLVLFSFAPAENLVNYYDEEYKLKFILCLSDSIKKVQLQIKDSHQIQFVDIAVERGVFCVPMWKLSRRESWQDVKEICFVVFAEDGYIIGENGYVEIRDFCLSK